MAKRTIRITAQNHGNEIINIAILTNKQLLVKILVAIKSLGNDAKQWLLSTSAGRCAYVHIGQCAAQAELLPMEWLSTFQKFMLESRVNDKEDVCDKIPTISTGELLKTAMEKIPLHSHRKRLSIALKMISTESTDAHEPTLTICQAVGLVRASTEVENRDMQSHTVSLFLQTLPDPNAINALASIQLPILQQIDHTVLENLLKCNEIDSGLTILFKSYGKCQDVSFEEAITQKDALKMLRFVEAADLARRGNQIGPKHGCIICVSRDIIESTGDMSIAFRESHESFKFSSCSGAPSNYDIIIGKGWNHNVFVNPTSKGGKKRVIHAEVHAVASAIQHFGENLAFDHLFPNAVVMIVELDGDAAYENAPPCPKCDTLLRAVGVGRACHSTNSGIVQDIELGSPNMEFLDRDTVKKPLTTACNELGIDCLRLRVAEERISNKDSANSTQTNKTF